MPEPVELIHVWHACHHCGAQPIKGKRYECQSCRSGPHKSLCETCYLGYRSGRVQHPHPRASMEPDVRRHHVFQAFEGMPRASAASWVQGSEATNVPPKFSDCFVLRPEFCCSGESFFGSYAFAIRAESGPAIVLTALHVLDEIIKWMELRGLVCDGSHLGTVLAAAINKVVLYDVFASPWMTAELGSARTTLVFPGSYLGAEEPYVQGDVAGFLMNDAPTGVTPAMLACHKPDVGETIWLVANAQQPRRQPAASAVVVEATNETFVFRFSMREASLPLYTSGAPLVDRWGQVVGLNVGMGKVDGVCLGHGVHAGSIRRHLGVVGLTALSATPGVS